MPDKLNNEPEIIMLLNKQYLIETNRQILERHKKLTGEKVFIGTLESIDDIIPYINRVGNSGIKKEDLIEKTTHILAFLAWKQPFLDGNRRTGIIAAPKFLRDNGYELNIESGEANLQIRKMLKEIKLHYSYLHSETMKQMSFYISKRIKLYES